MVEVLWIVLGVTISLLVGVLIHSIVARSVVPNRYEWLELLSTSDWRSIPDIREMMRKRKNTTLKLRHLALDDLHFLEQEGLVESIEGEPPDEDSIPPTLYRLATSGKRRKLIEHRSVLA